MGLGKKICGGLQKFVMILSFNFIPPDQISNMSLNELKRRFATRNKNLTQHQMDELLIALDLGKLVLFRGNPQLSFCFP
jgi:hypothetical protein